MRTIGWRHCLLRAIRSKQIDRLVPWESFRADIEAVVLTPDEMRKSSAGRKPLDVIVMFRMLVLQALNNLSDEQGLSGA
jgi:IS5 family transposase